MEQKEHDEYWSLYLACVSNPLTEDVSFEEFMSRVKSGQKKESSKTVQSKVNKVDVKKQVYTAELVLKNFVPPTKGGVE